MGDLLDLFPGGFSPEPELTPDPPERQLAEAMIDGLGLAPENIVLDGNLHRFGKDRVCWYVAHADNIPAGTFGSWRTGHQETWIANVGRDLTEEERGLSMAAIERAQQQRKEAEAEKHRQSASRAQQLVDTCKPAPSDHPYLTAKGIAPGPALVMSDGRLLLPMYDVEGGICSVQMISQTGQKQFLTGGKVRGALGHVGTMKGASRCYLAEGFATASTIHEATGSPVFFAYSAHNLPPVAEYVASLGVPLTIVADNDESGTGQRYARKASELTGCHVVTPSAGDVNDFALSGGDVKALLGHSTDDWLIPFSELVQQPRPVRWLIKKWLPQGGLAMVYGPSGLGKAQPLDEPVLTQDGWSPMGDIKAGDHVIGSAGLPTKVLAVHPQGELEEWEVEFSDGEVVRCCGDHLWHVTRSGNQDGRPVMTKDLNSTRDHRYWKVPIVKPVNYRANPNPLPLDPYLVGALIGDGGLTAFPGFSSADQEILDEVSKRIPPGHTVSHYSNYDYRIVVPRGQVNFVWVALRMLGLAGKKSDKKSVPEEYMTASAAQRLLLLQGLMDTDGYVSASNGTTCEFASSSATLTKQVRELVQSLGGICNQIRTKKTSGLDCHMVSFRMDRGVTPFIVQRKAQRCNFRGTNLNRRIVRVEKNGKRSEMQCITVASPDSLYVTKGFTVTHNTFLVLDMALSIATGREWGGRIVKATPVAYLAGEGYAGLATRLKGQAITHQISDAPFWVSRGGCQLDTPDGYNFARTELSKLPDKPGLIIVDTLHRFLSGDENSSQDAGKMVQACDKLGQEFGATVLLVHHTGHGGERARGSTAWRGALDTEISLSRLDDGELLIVGNPKQKDAEGATDTFGRLNSVNLPWVDEDGDTVSTAVWEQCEAPQNDPGEGLRNEISLFERAWWASGAEEHGGAPYVSRSALAAFLEKDCAKDSRALKREMEGASGLVCKLGRGEIIAAESYGYVASETGLVTRLLLAKRENMEADETGG